jgi:hypothetical protein
MKLTSRISIYQQTETAAAETICLKDWPLYNAKQALKKIL